MIRTAYFDITDMDGQVHNCSCRFKETFFVKFDEDKGLGFVVRGYPGEPNKGIKSIRFMGVV